MNIIVTILLTVVIFMLIIMIHEFGHFVAAKALHVKVHEFSIGFGPKIWKKQGKETLYSLRIFPIGGFVSLEGEDASSDDPNALSKKPVWARFIVMAAGATFNIISGFIALLIMCSSIQAFPTLEIGSLNTGIPDAPAPQVLHVGDKITAINGNRLWSYSDLSFLMSTEADGSETQLTVKRDGEKINVKMTPVLYEGGYKFGFAPKMEDANAWTVTKYAFSETLFTGRIVFYSLKMLVTGQVGIQEVSGPVGTGQIIGDAVELAQEQPETGIPNLLNIFSLLAINIGIFNLIPFPALDGGRIFFLLIELLRRKPLPPEKEGIVHFIGLALLLLLMVFITSSDIMKLFA